nr:citrate:proton symporter [Marinimicrobium alkaliphilum]
MVVSGVVSMLTLIGLLTVLTIVLLLVLRKVTPIVGLTLIPFCGAVLAGFGFDEIGAFFTTGLGSVVQVATMFIFAIIFFGVLQDAGLFNPLVRFLVKISGGNVISVAIGTAIVGMLAHLDGAGATTFLLTIPALLPLYKRLGMNPYLMMMLLATGAGILNLMPWAGPVGRAAAVFEMDPIDVWQPLIPVQAVGAVLLVVFAGLFGIREKRRIAKGGGMPVEDDSPYEPAVDTAPEDAELVRPKLLWLNFVVFLAVLTSLVTGILPSAYIFMLGLGVVLLLNYPSVTMQMERIKAHAPNALLMGAIILSAGSLLGILNGTGMLRSIAEDMVLILPDSVIPHLHLIIGVFGLPLDLLLSTDAYYFALLPIVEQIVATHDVPTTSTIYALIIGNVIGTFLSPFSPALWLGLGLAGLEIGKHLRYSFIWMWIFSLILMAFAIPIGLIP